MPFAAALSQHPVTALATGEVAGEVLDRLGPGVDLALLFVSRQHAGALEDAAAAIRALLHPVVLVGCAAAGVAGGGSAVQGRAGVSLWAGRFGPVSAVRLDGPVGFPELAVRGWPDTLPFVPSALLLIGDPASFDAVAAVERLRARHPGLRVVGGMASAASGRGGNRLALDGHVYVDGAVGVLLGEAAGVETVVSQGCRPIGEPLVVTRAERGVIYELAGRPPLERLDALARDRLDADDVKLVNDGLFLGLVVDEHKDRFGPGDFLVRRVIGGDRQTGAIAVDADAPIGSTVQFHVRDAASAHTELRALLAGVGEVGAALLFSGDGRGQQLFGDAEHDAALLSMAIDGAPSAGFAAAGELGPIGAWNALHSSSASIALFAGP